MRRFPILLAAALAVGGCAPRAAPLTGAVAPARLPRADMARGHRKILFRWRYDDNEFSFRGEGVARTSYPDSARLDFFLDGGAGGGRAVLVGNELRVPGPEFIRSLLPPTPLLWASLGRLSLPAVPDTAVRIDADTLRADIGRDPRWRASFVADDLRQLELIEGGRIEQSVARQPGGSVRYHQARNRRTLDLVIVRVDTVGGFDAAIWR